MPSKSKGITRWIKHHPYLFSFIIIAVVGLSVGLSSLAAAPSDAANQGFVDWRPYKIGDNLISGTQYDYNSGGNHYIGNIYCSNLVMNETPIDVDSYSLPDGRVVKVRNYFYNGKIVADTTAKATYVVQGASPGTISIGQIHTYQNILGGDKYEYAVFPTYSVPGTAYPYFNIGAAGNHEVLYYTTSGTNWRTQTDNYRVVGPIWLSVSIDPTLQAWDQTSKDGNNYYVCDGTWAGVVTADAMEDSSYGLLSTGGATIGAALGTNPVASGDMTDSATATGDRTSANMPTPNGIDLSVRLHDLAAGELDTHGNGFGETGLQINKYTGPTEEQGGYAVGETAGSKLTFTASDGDVVANNFIWDNSIGNESLSNVKVPLTCNIQPKISVYSTVYEYKTYCVNWGCVIWCWIWGNSDYTRKDTIISGMACDNVYVTYDVRIGVQLASTWDVVPQQFAQSSNSSAPNYVPDLDDTPSTWATNNTYNNDVISQTTGVDIGGGLDLGAILEWFASNWWWIVLIVVAIAVVYIYFTYFAGRSSGGVGGGVGGGTTININSGKVT